MKDETKGKIAYVVLFAIVELSIILPFIIFGLLVNQEMMIVNEEINAISEEQVLHNELSFEINQELIHLMKLIVEIQRVNKILKENNMSMQEEMVRTWEKADLYKEVIEKVREYIEDWLFDAGGNGASMTYEDINELLQILDKVKD